MFGKQQEQQLEEARAIVQKYRPIAELVPANWSEGDVPVNGVRLHYYRTGGSGPTLLLLHGFEEYGLTWLRVARELEHEYDIVMVDARGHGHSEGMGQHGYPPGVMIEDAAGFIRVLGLGPARIIGFSMGGDTALRLAATYPELVHSFLYEGWSDGFNGQNLAESKEYQAWFTGYLERIEAIRKLDHRERMVAALGQLLPMMGGSIWPEDEYVPEVEGYALFDLELARFSMQLWSPEYQIDKHALLKDVRCPALIMKQASGFPVPGARPEVKEVASDQENIRIVSFENTGHMLRRSAFDAYMKLVREFLTDKK